MQRVQSSLPSLYIQKHKSGRQKPTPPKPNVMLYVGVLRVQTHTLHGLGYGHQSDDTWGESALANLLKLTCRRTTHPLNSAKNRCIIRFADDFVPS
jgi:hypothetical protein